MDISVSGGRVKQRELVDSIVSMMTPVICGTRLSRVLSIDIAIKKKLDADGWCEWMDDNIRPREFYIQLRMEQSYPSLIVSVVHELIHVRQMARSELYEIFRPKHMQVWHGRRLARRLPYSKQPWEREAYRLQVPYAREYVERSGLVLTGRTYRWLRD